MTEALHHPIEANMTAEMFETFVTLEENLERNWELIDGEIVEKMVSHPRSSMIASTLLFFVQQYVRETHSGYVTMADGGYKVNRNRLIPDIGFVRRDRYSEAVEGGYQVIAPDLAIEVLSPNDKLKKVQKKIAAYLDADTVVWLVSPKTETIIVYDPHKLPHTLQRGDTLAGGDVLPGFSLTLDTLFDL